MNPGTRSAVEDRRYGHERYAEIGPAGWQFSAPSGSGAPEDGLQGGSDQSAEASPGDAPGALSTLVHDSMPAPEEPASSASVNPLVGRTGTEVLVSEPAWRRYGRNLQTAAPDAQWLIMDDSGSLVCDGCSVEWADAAPHSAWIDADILATPLLRKFLGFLVRNQSIYWLHVSAAGVDAAPFRALHARGVVISNDHLGGTNVAEYVLGQVLAHRLGLHEWRLAQRDRKWQPHRFHEVSGSTWLIIGLGAVGSAIAERVAAFNGRTIGVRRNVTGYETADMCISPTQVLEAVPEADVVVLAAPLTDSTAHIVNDAFLRRMRRGSILVNVGRGALVDETALVRALDRGVPEVAILDVVESEPLPADDPLWSHPRVVLTPHSAGGSEEYRSRSAGSFCAQLTRFVEGRPLANTITTGEFA